LFPRNRQKGEVTDWLTGSLTIPWLRALSVFWYQQQLKQSELEVIVKAIEDAKDQDQKEEEG